MNAKKFDRNSSILLNGLASLISLDINTNIDGVRADLFSHVPEYVPFKNISKGALTSGLSKELKEIDLTKDTWLPNEYQFAFFSNLERVLPEYYETQDEVNSQIYGYGKSCRSKMLSSPGMGLLIKGLGRSVENLSHVIQDFTYLTTLFREINIKNHGVVAHDYETKEEIFRSDICVAPFAKNLFTTEGTMWFFSGSADATLSMSEDEVLNNTWEGKKTFGGMEYNPETGSAVMPVFYIKKTKKSSQNLRKFLTFLARPIHKKRKEAKLAHDMMETIIRNNIDIVEHFNEEIFERDEGTGKHVNGVTLYSVLTGHFLGLPKKVLKDTVLTSLLHDIGKNGIVDEVLLKKGRFNTLERVIMDSHGPLGTQFLLDYYRNDSERDNKLQTITGTYFHHENCLGTGYLFQKRAEEIPFLGKMLSFCDVFDALLQKRSYKDELELPEVISFFKDPTKFKKGYFHPIIEEVFFDFIIPHLNYHIRRKGKKNSAIIKKKNFSAKDINDVIHHKGIMRRELDKEFLAMCNGNLSWKNFLKNLEKDIDLEGNRLFSNEKLSRLTELKQLAKSEILEDPKLDFQETQALNDSFFKGYSEKLHLLERTEILNQYLISNSSLTPNKIPENLLQFIENNKNSFRITSEDLKDLHHSSRDFLNKNISLGENSLAVQSIKKALDLAPSLEEIINEPLEFNFQK